MTDALRAENEQIMAALTWRDQRIEKLHGDIADLRAENERLQTLAGGLVRDNSQLTQMLTDLRAVLKLGQTMIDTLDDEGEFDVDAVHAFAKALNEHFPIA